tara:strand:+ start:2009 stop:2305 length:297 start_codon:yes stop_codon:yes gene_type:complete
VSNNIIDVNSIGEVDQLNGREKIIQCVTSLRLHPYNPGVPCGPKAIQIKLREEEISPVPSISTIAIYLKQRHVTNGRTGYYEEDYQRYRKPEVRTTQY